MTILVFGFAAVVLFLVIRAIATSSGKRPSQRGGADAPGMDTSAWFVAHNGFHDSGSTGSSGVDHSSYDSSSYDSGGFDAGGCGGGDGGGGGGGD